MPRPLRGFAGAAHALLLRRGADKRAARMNLRTKARLAGAAILASALSAAPLADAQAPPAGAGPAPDPTPIWTLQDENASVSTAKLTDRYYVNGLRLGFTSGTDQTPSILQGLGEMVFGQTGQQRFTFDLSQQIFTPADTAARIVAPDDRPYAGVLVGTFGLLQDTRTTRSTIALSLGVTGPAALGEQIQNGFHDLIGQGHDAGWHDQLRNEPAVNLLVGRTWREPTGHLFGLDTDALLDASAGLGSVRVYGEGGGQLRIGQGLDSDFGVARVQPGMSGGDAFRPTRPVAWYVFAGADGQGVAYDVTLQGTTPNDTPTPAIKPFVGEIEGGLAVMAFGTRLTYTQVFQTQEFQHQKGGLHQFGSLALSVRF